MNIEELEKKKEEVSKKAKEEAEIRRLKKEIKEQKSTYGTGRVLKETGKTVKSFGGGLLVGLKQTGKAIGEGMKGLKREAPAIAKTFDTIAGERKTSGKLPSIFGEGFKVEEPKSYFEGTSFDIFPRRKIEIEKKKLKNKQRYRKGKHNKKKIIIYR
jgi:hypothetical protein